MKNERDHRPRGRIRSILDTLTMPVRGRASRLLLAAAAISLLGFLGFKLSEAQQSRSNLRDSELRYENIVEQTRARTLLAQNTANEPLPPQGNTIPNPSPYYAPAQDPNWGQVPGPGPFFYSGEPATVGRSQSLPLGNSRHLPPVPTPDPYYYSAPAIQPVQSADAFHPPNSDPFQQYPAPARNVSLTIAPQLRELQQLLGDQERELQSLAQRYSRSGNDTQRAEQRKQMEENIRRQFAYRQQMREKELKALEEHLQKLRGIHAERGRQQDRIINDRVQQVINEATGLGWGTAGLGEEWNNVAPVLPPTSLGTAGEVRQITVKVPRTVTEYVTEAVTVTDPLTGETKVQTVQRPVQRTVYEDRVITVPAGMELPSNMQLVPVPEVQPTPANTYGENPQSIPGSAPPLPRYDPPNPPVDAFQRVPPSPLPQPVPDSISA